MSTTSELLTSPVKTAGFGGLIVDITGGGGVAVGVDIIVSASESTTEWKSSISSSNSDSAFGEGDLESCFSGLPKGGTRIALSLLVRQSVFGGFGESLEVCGRLGLEVDSLTIWRVRRTGQTGQAGQAGQTGQTGQTDTWPVLKKKWKGGTRNQLNRTKVYSLIGKSPLRIAYI